MNAFLFSKIVLTVFHHEDVLGITLITVYANYSNFFDSFQFCKLCTFQLKNNIKFGHMQKHTFMENRRQYKF